jgi:hypothetical protein
MHTHIPPSLPPTLTGIIKPPALEHDEHPVLLGTGCKRAQGILALFPRVQGQLIPEVLREGWEGGREGGRIDNSQRPHGAALSLYIPAPLAC